MECENEIRRELQMLLSGLSCDFCALALKEKDSGALKWTVVVGNLNERCLNMADPPNRGLSGTVAKVGRPMTLQVSELVRSRDLYNYPIMISEKLRSAYAVPLMKNAKAFAILLAGDRKRRVYRPDERSAAIASGERLLNLLSGIPGQMGQANGCL
ncbi:GAF domain-containing protein [Cohnella soli]|uniref:GAF domain-containing protein n=1 Tax=Cohnella soli TaxID=425005 RepID=A0ABW0I0J2_9BACL